MAAVTPKYLSNAKLHWSFIYPCVR